MKWAVLSKILLNLVMISDSGNKLSSLGADGGATDNNFLMLFQADLLRIPVEKPVITEMRALGVAHLPGMGAGFWQSQNEIATQWKIARVFEPKMCEDRIEALPAEWKKAVKRSFGWAKNTD
jgi:glycerol kinase